MNIDTDALLALSPADKLKLVELLWDDLGQSGTELPLPEWVETEAHRRLEEMRSNPSLGMTHEEVWSKVSKRNG